MITEHNISIDVGPDLVLSSKMISQTDKGISIQTIVINNSSAGNSTNATLVIYSIPMYREDLNTTNSTDFSKFVENVMIGAFQLTGGKVVKELTVKNSLAENVTIRIMGLPKSKAEPKGDRFSFAIWPIDSRNIMMLLSHLDEDANAKIVETLKVKS